MFLVTGIGQMPRPWPDLRGPDRLTQHGMAATVVQDYESYQHFQDSVAFLRLMVQGEADIIAGFIAEEDSLRQSAATYPGGIDQGFEARRSQATLTEARMCSTVR